MFKPKVIKSSDDFNGAEYLKVFRFRNGHKVPIFRINTVNGLNQIVGHIKFINSDYGRVYCRGQTKLYNTVMPNAARNDSKFIKTSKRIEKLRKNIENDKDLMSQIEISSSISDSTHRNFIFESLLQHYGVSTYCLDAVDNQWIALWFGQFQYEGGDPKYNYGRYSQRVIPSKDLKADDEDLYQYILLLATDGYYNETGFINGNDIATIDLRQALPSTFLRPHAQHAIMLKKRMRKGVSNWDMANNVVGILQIRIDNAKKWLGEGELLESKALFPSKMDDDGYRILVERTDIFCGFGNRITDYQY